MTRPTVPELSIAASVLRRLSAAHVNHKRIGASALLIGALTMVAKLFVAGREIAIAWRYGVSGTVDAYQLAVTIVTWVPMMLSGAMGVVLVPLLVRLRRRRDARKAFLGELNGSALLLALGVAAGTILLSPVAGRLLAWNLSRQTVTMMTAMAFRMVPVAFAMSLTGYFTARLQSRERFGYTVTEAVPALVIMIFIVGPLSVGGLGALIEGTVIGFCAQLALLAALVARGDPPFGAVRIRHRSNEWRAIYASALMMGAGQLVITAANPVDQGFAARVGEGSVAILGYASRILTLITGLATVVIGRALLPVLSNAVADGHFSLGRRQALQWAALMFCAASVGGVLLWIIAPDLVRLLFQRGAFGQKASAEVARAVRFGTLQLPFYFAGIVLVQWYAATDRFRDILLITVAALTVKVISNALLAPMFGVGGIMLSTALMYLMTCFLLVVMLYRLGGCMVDHYEREIME